MLETKGGNTIFLQDSEILNDSYKERMTQEGPKQGSIDQYFILSHSARVDFSVEPFHLHSPLPLVNLLFLSLVDELRNLTAV